MNAPDPKLLDDGSSHALAAEIAWLGRALAEPGPGEGEATAERSTPLRGEWVARSPLDEVAARFGLSEFERSVLLLAAAPDLDAGFARTWPRPTAGLALARLPQAHWSALAPDGPLRAWRLVTLQHGAAEGDAGLVSARLVLDEAVLHRLAGLGALAGPGGVDAQLAPWVQPHEPREAMEAAQREAAQRVARQLLERNPARALVLLHGDDARGQQDVAAWIAARLGRRLLRIDAAALPADPVAQRALATLWRREARWLDLALLIEGLDADAPAHDAAAAESFAGEGAQAVASRAARFAAMLEGLVLTASAQPVAALDATHLVPVDKPHPAARRRLWHEALRRHALVPADEAGEAWSASVDALAAQFPLGAAQIDDVAGEVAAASSLDAQAAPERLLWEACRLRARRSYGALARCIEPAAGWDDLVLPEPHLAQLRRIAAQVRLALKVHEDWGFAPPGGAAPGVTALFWGDSGVGKTLACEVLAHELHLDLVRVDLAGAVSKYIGETEKNLRRVFDAAEAAGALLLFDEADALFGQRSEVRDSHDRYANQEVAWLLQRMESHRGLTVLTTNQREALDPAFLRRLRFVLPFPFPDAAQRERLWRRMVPPQAPQQALDFRQLAALPLAGGAIRNAALNAAFLAADERRPLAMRHFAEAARHEAAKDERPLPESLLRAWEGGHA